MTRQPTHGSDRLFWVLIVTSQAVHARLCNRTRTQLNPLMPLTDGVRFAWLIIIPKDDEQFVCSPDADSGQLDIADNCQRLGTSLREKGWDKERVASAVNYLRQTLQESPESQPALQRGLRSRAAAMIQEVWAEDPDAELLVVEPVQLPEFHARLGRYPRAKIDPTSDPKWCEQIQTDIRYGMGELP